MKKFTTLILALMFAGVLARCAHDSKKQNNDTLDYLNGNNYQTPGTGIPIVSDQKSPLSTISGSLLMTTSTSIPEPLKYQTLILIDGKKKSRALKRMRVGILFSRATSLMASTRWSHFRKNSRSVSS